MAWLNSSRRARLPDNWPELRTKVKARAKGKCEATHHDPRCDLTGTDCDHIVTGDDHSLENLQLLSVECHKRKTAEENAALNRLNSQLRRRPQEDHPGRIG